jgi:hypothetical protein
MAATPSGQPTLPRCCKKPNSRRGRKIGRTPSPARKPRLLAGADQTAKLAEFESVAAEQGRNRIRMTTKCGKRDQDRARQVGIWNGYQAARITI